MSSRECVARLLRRLTVPIALASALGIAPACSLSLDGPRPQRLLSERPVCDTSKGLVAVDGIVGSVLGIGAIGVANDSSGAALVLALLGTAYLASAVHGNGVVDECHEASGSWERDYVDRRPMLPPDERVVAAPPMRMRRPPVVSPQPAVASPPPAAPVRTAPPSVEEQRAPVAQPARTNDAGAWSSFWEETP
ncbi:hypothetical protein BH11MYX2_BH11MYX2_39830 [soil metagenome]